jgi:hypothetical protein
MKTVLAILAVILMLPVLAVVGIALGPAALVLLFIGGFALIIAGLGWLFDVAKARRASSRLRRRHA